MKVKITPTGESAQVMEFNVSYVTNIFGKPVKFNDEDITQLLNLFKQFKQI